MSEFSMKSKSGYMEIIYKQDNAEIKFYVKPQHVLTKIPKE